MSGRQFDDATSARVVTEVLYRGLNHLDAAADSDLVDRLELVLALLTESANAAGWMVLQLDDAEQTRTSARRALPAAAVVTDSIASGTGLIEAVTDSEGLRVESREAPCLLTAGLLEALVVGGYAPDARRVVVEIYADEATGSMRTWWPVVYALVQAALSFPRPANPVPVPWSGRSAV